MADRDFYTGKQGFWSRLDKNIQSDFICRPQAVRLAGDVSGRKIADIGCGEGYVSRILTGLGAEVIAVDRNADLIDSAKHMENELHQGIVYHVADATKSMLNCIPKNSQDLAFSICVTPHFKYGEMVSSFKNTAQVLKKDGEFILAVPHPEIYRNKLKSNWLTFDYESLPSEPDVAVPITLYTGDGKSFSVEAYTHVGEYEKAIAESGFVIKEIIEPLASGEDVKVFPERWGREQELPFYRIYKLVKGGIGEDDE